jgi:hypothetical protein
MPVLENEIDELTSRIWMVEFMLLAFAAGSLAAMPGEYSEEAKRELLAGAEKRPKHLAQAMLDNRRYGQIANRCVEMAKEFIADAATAERTIRGN